ncbi:dTMP kinase [Microcoleus sp. FACHB-1515]|uniref:dTMP kinase n=1 Tax=Cyanophyceae TaxID=3028117 RepID=UPI0016826949|nr:dTMP kinase [Microcoleus sp. FACHB-1515]MBD2089601.1 dTMP kinase [Microcoleus sp. FACHB-1515]
MRGKLIVFEGVEGCGKTTQISRLETWLRTSGLFNQLQQSGCVCELIVTREPGGTPLAQQIRRLLLTPTEAESWSDRAELLLYAADRAQHVAHQLQPQLANGALILCDRFTDSTLAYQGYGRGLDLALIDQLNAIATDKLTSDLTFWLDLDVSVGLARAAERNGKVIDRIEQAGLAFHQRVQRGFTELAQASDRTISIDASRSPDEVAQAIQTVFTQQMQQWYPQLSLR